MFKNNFNISGNKSFLDKYKCLKNKVTGMLRQSQKKLFNETVNSEVKNPKSFYRTAKKLNIISDKKNSGKVNFSPELLNETFIKNNNAVIDHAFIEERVRILHNNTLPSIHKFTLQAKLSNY